MTAVDKVDNVDEKVDGRVHHRPLAGPEIVGKALAVVGRQDELAARLVVSRETLRLIASGRRELRYPMQVALEQIARGRG